MDLFCVIQHINVVLHNTAELLFKPYNIARILFKYLQNTFVSFRGLSGNEAYINNME